MRDGLWATTDRLPPELVPPPGTMPYFLPGDIGEDARVVDPSELSEEHDVVECVVTRQRDRRSPQEEYTSRPFHRTTQPLTITRHA